MRTQLQDPTFTMTGFRLRGVTAPVVVSFTVGYGIGMMLNATVLATPIQVSASDLSPSTQILGER